MSEKDQIQRALEDINIMYSKLVKDGKKFDVHDYYTGVNDSKPWNQDPSTGLALFNAD